MSDSLLPAAILVSLVVLVGVALWSWRVDHTSYIGRVLLFGIACASVWAVTLATLIVQGDSLPIRALWLPSATGTGASVYLLAKLANAPSWRPPRWLLALLATEMIAISVLTTTNDHHQLVAPVISSAPLEYGWGFGMHVLLCFVLIGLGALEMGRRNADPVRWVRRYALLIQILVVLTCTLQLLQVRVSQLLAAVALTATAVAIHRGGLGQPERALGPYGDHIDPVSGTLTRRGIEHVLLNSSRRADGHCHVLVIDVDRFKGINDTFGHMAGDEVLAEVARRLQSVDSRLQLGRFGGDEFVGLLREDDPGDAGRIVGRMAKAVSETPMLLHDGRRVAVSVSIGLAPCTGTDWRAWVAAADTAMYERKAAREVAPAGRRRRRPGASR